MWDDHLSSSLATYTGSMQVGHLIKQFVTTRRDALTKKTRALHKSCSNMGVLIQFVGNMSFFSVSYHEVLKRSSSSFNVSLFSLFCFIVSSHFSPSFFFFPFSFSFSFCQLEQCLWTIVSVMRTISYIKGHRGKNGKSSFFRHVLLSFPTTDSEEKRVLP